MSVTLVTTIVGLSVAVAYVAVHVFRYRRNLDELLRPIVEKHGLAFVDSRSPFWFRTGPFSLITDKVGNYQTEIFGMPGEYWTYRIVRVREADRMREVWVRLYFEAFQLKEAEWWPSLQSGNEA